LAKKRSQYESLVRKKTKELCAAYDNYEAAVLLISSVEAWFEHNWGPKGRIPGLMTDFDRFPRIGSLTPDFVAKFATPYIICGEHKKTFPAGRAGQDNVKQILAYSDWKPKHTDGRGVPLDVLVLVNTHSDDKAAKAIDQARRKAAAPGRAPIIIMGFYADARANGDWFSLKWRNAHGNCRFSVPNVAKQRGAQDLNSLLIDPDPSAIRIDYSAVNATDRNPLINDEPPVVYTIARVVFPALNDLLTESDRDQLSIDGEVRKVLSRSQILSAPVLAGLSIPERYVQNALQAMEKVGLAHRVNGSQPPVYEITVNLKNLKRDLRDWLPEKHARRLVRLMQARRTSRKKRRGESKGQLPLFE